MTAAIPSHTGLSTRVRMPFFLIPGDLFLLAPLYFIAPDRYMQMAVTASNGGFLRWQSGWATPIGRFQFVLGRELGVTFFGLDEADRLFMPSANSGRQRPSSRLTSHMYFDLPVLEYRPFRAFSSNQSAALMMQLFTGCHGSVLHEGDPACGRARRGSRPDLVRRSAARPRLEVLSMTAFATRNKKRRRNEHMRERCGF